MLAAPPAWPQMQFDPKATAWEAGPSTVSVPAVPLEAPVFAPLPMATVPVLLIVNNPPVPVVSVPPVFVVPMLIAAVLVEPLPTVSVLAPVWDTSDSTPLIFIVADIPVALFGASERFPN